MIIALIGNQNCGKTTLFNALTGSNQHVGNFPGVTVEKKDGIIKGNTDMVLVDLPGLYSLSTYTAEETVARDFLLKERPDCIINIVDATSIERSLYLSLQLFELQIPTVLALNRMDAAKSAGIEVDIPKLSSALSVPIIPVTASQGEGTDTLVQAVRLAVQKHELPQIPKFDMTVETALGKLAGIIREKAQNNKIPIRFCASKLLDQDPSLTVPFELSKEERTNVLHIVKTLEDVLSTDSYAALAGARYSLIEKLCTEYVKKPVSLSKEERISESIDRLLTGKYTAFPLFFLILGSVFFFTFVFPGGTLSSLFTSAINAFIALSDRFLSDLHVAPALHSLIIGGIFTGIGSILSFLPTIVTLFFFLSLLEDTGYMARVAFIMDKPMRAIGLSGKTFVPLLIGFGCSVPAVMAARTVASETERKKAIYLVPFISCSAKLPIYALFTSVFFPKNPLPVIASLYTGAVLIGILVMLLLKSDHDQTESFVMELPTYRLPTARNTFTLMAQKAKDFLVKAFTVIFLSTVILWFLQNFGFSLTLVSDSSDSILAAVGRTLAPIFAPLGFANWKTVTALITGLTAKEAVISSLKILLSSSLPFEEALRAEFSSTASVLSFLTFALLYMPCVAAAAAIGRELSSFWATCKRMLFQTGVAWICAFLVYHIVSVFCN